MRAIVAHSDLVDSIEAIEAVLTQARAELGSDTPRGAVLFTTSEYDHAAIQARIARHWPGLPLIGASTDGELSSQLGYCGDSVCLTLLVGQGFEVRAGQGLGPSVDLAHAIDEAVAALGDARPALCVALCPGTTGNPSAVIRDLHAALGERACPVVGGLAGDHEVAPTTRQFFGTESHHDSLSVLFLCGDDLKVSWGVASGWFPIGKKHRVTRSEGNKVFEIDGKAALDIYHSFWGERVTGNLGEFPLAMELGPGAEDFILRAAMACDEGEGSVTFAGEVPQGVAVSLTEVVPDGLLSGTETSIRKAVERYPGRAPALAFLFSCAARKWVLGSRASEEIGQLMRSFEEFRLPHLDLAGFYAFGEICPLELDGPPLLHNETCVTVLIGR